MSTIRLTIILGSVTAPGRLHRAVHEAVSRLDGEAVSARVIDLAHTRIALADGRPPEQLGDDTAEVITAVAESDAVVLATPVYRGSLTGSLKNLLDQIPVPALRDTPTAIVSMGASDHHFLGAERHLRDVLAFFGAVVAPNAVYLTAADFSDGRPTEAAEETLDAALRSVIELAQLLDHAAFGPVPLAARRR